VKNLARKGTINCFSKKGGIKMLRIKQHKFIWFGIIVLGVILLGMPAVYAGDGQPPLDPAADEVNYEGDDYDADSEDPDYVLGSTTEDFVYTPVNPCRIIDTRNAGGPIGTDSFRSFYVYGSGVNMLPQGGNASGCPAPRGEPRGVVMNIVAVNSTAPGYLTVWPDNTTRPLASVLNYSPTDRTDPISNAFTVKTRYGAGREISVYVYKQTHVVADVMGYYYEAFPAGANYFGTDAAIYLTSTPMTVKSINMNVPYVGMVIVNASASVYLANPDGPDWCGCSIVKGSSTGIDGTAFFAVREGGNHDMVEVPIFGTKGFYASAGLNTFRLNCREEQGDVRIGDPSITAIWVPRPYN